MVGGSDTMTQELLPQLVPLFLVPPDQRPLFGSTIPATGPVATDAIPRLVKYTPESLSAYIVQPSTTHGFSLNVTLKGEGCFLLPK